MALYCFLSLSLSLSHTHTHTHTYSTTLSYLFDHSLTHTSSSSIKTNKKGVDPGYQRASDRGTKREAMNFHAKVPWVGLQKSGPIKLNYKLRGLQSK